MKREDFKEITEEHLNSVKCIVECGSCVDTLYVPCDKCPFYFDNTSKYMCHTLDHDELLKMAKEFVKTFGDK